MFTFCILEMTTGTICCWRRVWCTLLTSK